MKTYEQLLNNIIGQLEGVKKMLDEDRECLAILTQLKASRSALNAVMAKLLTDDLSACAAAKNSRQADKIKKLLTELVKN